MKAVSEKQKDSLLFGKVVSIRGSVVDIWFENSVPSINTVIHTGEKK